MEWSGLGDVWFLSFIFYQFHYSTGLFGFALRMKSRDENAFNAFYF
jgi:hypothetical protein